MRWTTRHGIRSVLALALALGVLPLAGGAQAPPARGGGQPAGTPVGPVSVGSVIFLGLDGGMDANRIAALLQARLAAFEACYEPVRERGAALSGEVQVDVTLARTGRVSALTAVGLAAAPQVAPCVGDVVRAMVFPRPSVPVRWVAGLRFRPVRAPGP